MPIANITTDYSNRTRDIHIFQGVDPARSASISPSFGRISNFCTGIQKLVQRYAITLLTNLGSQKDYPEFGSSLIKDLNTNQDSINRGDVFHLFNFANVKVLTEFKEYQRNNDAPDDEKLSTAVLVNSFVENDRIFLTIKIYPVQQDAVDFVLPLPT